MTVIIRTVKPRTIIVKKLIITLFVLMQASTSLALSPKTELRLLMVEQASKLCITKSTTISLANVQISSIQVAKDGSGWVKGGLKSARATDTFYLNFITKEFSCSKGYWEDSWDKLRKSRRLSWIGYSQDLSRELLGKWNNRAMPKGSGSGGKTNVKGVPAISDINPALAFGLKNERWLVKLYKEYQSTEGYKALAIASSRVKYIDAAGWAGDKTNAKYAREMALHWCEQNNESSTPCKVIDEQGME